jgi:hypothetical protein
MGGTKKIRYSYWLVIPYLFFQPSGQLSARLLF